MSLLYLRNPHSVLAAIATRPQDVSSIRANPQTGEPAWKEVLQAAAEHRIRLEPALPAARTRPRKGNSDGREGATGAEVRPRSDDDQVYFELELRDAWVWDMYRPARFVTNVKVLTFRDVNVEELAGKDL